MLNNYINHMLCILYDSALIIFDINILVININISYVSEFYNMKIIFNFNFILFNF